MSGDGSEMPEDGSPVKWVGSGGAVLHEYLVDVLGGLVPGILFAVGAGVALVPPLFAVHRALQPEPVPVISLSSLGALVQWPTTLLFFGCVGVAFMTYVAGQVFYRRDPKEPDQASFRLLRREKIVELRLGRDGKPPGVWRRLVTRNWYRLQARFGNPSRLLKKNEEPKLSDYLKKDLGAPSDDECEFPYPNFLDYLKKRGLDHLKTMVKWSDRTEKDGRRTRSKLWVNVLKVRLMMHYPQKCRQIVHNEAHIRLASGTWHVTKALRGLALVGLALVVVAISMKTGWRLTRQIVGQAFWTFLSPLAVLIIAWYLRRKIDCFYHYQRMREVDIVLETAFTAFHDQQNLLGPPFRFDEPEPAGQDAGEAVKADDTAQRTEGTKAGGDGGDGGDAGARLLASG
ncbi:MAG: hypothetical protein ABSF35_23120 [Polyangia bacterium]|jgi:hypothetical protein